MMKYFMKIGIFLISVQIIGAQDAAIEFDKGIFFCVLSLPCKVNKETKSIFKEDTQYAIDILEITIDDEILLLSPDPIERETDVNFKLRSIAPDENYFFARMHWTRFTSRDVLVWSDGLMDGCYMIKSGDKEMKIKYRIIFPFPLMTLKKLWKKQIPQKAYSQEYEVTVNLLNAFE